MTLTLPQSYRDAGFRRHIERLERAEALHGRDSIQWRSILTETWVKDAPFADAEVATHCPHGHVDAHEIAAERVNHQGRECVPRRCLVCSSSWLEPLP